MIEIYINSMIVLRALIYNVFFTFYISVTRSELLPQDIKIIFGEVSFCIYNLKSITTSHTTFDLKVQNYGDFLVFSHWSCFNRRSTTTLSFYLFSFNSFICPGLSRPILPSGVEAGWGFAHQQRDDRQLVPAAGDRVTGVANEGCEQSRHFRTELEFLNY